MSDKKYKKHQLTNEAILNAFIKCAKELGFDKVNITDICKKANIGRGTFYLHYRNLSSLLNAIENKIIGDFIEAIKEDKLNGSFLYIEVIVNYIYSHQDLFSVITNVDTGVIINKIIDTLIELVCEERQKLSCELNGDMIDFDTYYRTYGLKGVLIDWIQNYYSIDKEVLSKTLNEIINKLNTDSSNLSEVR